MDAVGSCEKDNDFAVEVIVKILFGYLWCLESLITFICNRILEQFVGIYAEIYSTISFFTINTFIFLAAKKITYILYI